MNDSQFFGKIVPGGTADKPAAKWGLVLSGGGTKGAYEIGAWKALKELQIPISGIAGTSVGALNAAMFLCLDIKQIERIYQNLKIYDVLPVSGNIDPTKNVFDPVNLLAITREYLSQRGLDNAPLRRMLESNLDISRIYSSSLDLGIVTFNVLTREVFQIFKEDVEQSKLIDYLLASANFPIFKSQKVDGVRFLDGGFYDNMPFNPLIERGYTNLIVIDINGIGLTRKVENAEKVYLKMISCSEDLGGIFDFDPVRIRRNITLGYLDTLKAFHRLFGSYFFFRRPAFNELLMNFDLDTIWGLETAGKLYGMERNRIYQMAEFLSELENRHGEMEQEYLRSFSSGLFGTGIPDLPKAIKTGAGIPAFVQFFTEQPANRNSSLAKAFPDLTDAANAIIALKNHRKL